MVGETMPPPCPGIFWGLFFCVYFLRAAPPARDGVVQVLDRTILAALPAAGILETIGGGIRIAVIAGISVAAVTAEVGILAAAIVEAGILVAAIVGVGDYGE